MSPSTKDLIFRVCICAALMGVAACQPRKIPTMTVEDLMEDRVTLDGVLLKCNQNSPKAHNTAECLNARIAIERLAKDKEVDPSIEQKRQEEFERSRERLRLAQEKQREAEEAKSKVDPYSLPVLPPDPNATAAPPKPDGSQPAPPH